MPVIDMVLTTWELILRAKDVKRKQKYKYEHADFFCFASYTLKSSQLTKMLLVV